MKKILFLTLGLILSGFTHYAGQFTSIQPSYAIASDRQPNILQTVNQQACEEWVDSVMNKLSLKEKVGQLFIHTIAPQEDKKNLENLHDAVNTYKVGGLLFSGEIGRASCRERVSAPV